VTVFPSKSRCLSLKNISSTVKTGGVAFLRLRKSGKHKTLAFKKLPTIFEDIIKEASSMLPNVDPHLYFRYKPNEAPASECQNDTRPDGHLELKGKKNLGEIVTCLLFSPESFWEDIVLPFEFKVDEKDYLDMTPGKMGDFCPTRIVTQIRT
jgi:hypothetical protein